VANLCVTQISEKYSPKEKIECIKKPSKTNKQELVPKSVSWFWSPCSGYLWEVLIIFVYENMHLPLQPQNEKSEKKNLFGRVGRSETGRLTLYTGWCTKCPSLTEQYGSLHPNVKHSILAIPPLGIQLTKLHVCVHIEYSIQHCCLKNGSEVHLQESVNKKSVWSAVPREHGTFV
jgi:hypothetical protein